MHEVGFGVVCCPYNNSPVKFGPLWVVRRTCYEQARPSAAPPHEMVLPLWQALWPVTSAESTYSIANDSSMPLRTNTKLSATLTRTGVTPQRKRGEIPHRKSDTSSITSSNTREDKHEHARAHTATHTTMHTIMDTLQPPRMQLRSSLHGVAPLLHLGNIAAATMAIVSTVATVVARVLSTAPSPHAPFHANSTSLSFRRVSSGE